MASLRPKRCLLLVILSLTGLLIIVLTVVSRNVVHYNLAVVVNNASLQAFFWNDSTSSSRRLRYISVKEIDLLLRQRGSAGNATEVNLQKMSAYDAKAEDEHKDTSSFNCSSVAANGESRKLSSWCTIRRYPDTVDVELLRKSNFLSTEVMNEVKYFVLFVGHSRSGSSITGALLDAHPNAMIGHEFHVFKNMQLHPGVYHSKDAIFTALALSSQISAKHWSSTPPQRRHNMYVKGLWMGQFEGNLSVIGDKGAMSMTTLYRADKSLFLKLLRRLQTITGVPIQFVQVIRNPFDNIATELIYSVDKGRLKAITHQTNGTLIDGERHSPDVLRTIRKHFNHAIAVDRLKWVEGLDVLQIHLSDLVLSPVSELGRLCSFLGIECSPRYLEGCRAALFKEVSQTRNKVQWTPDQIATVEKLAAQVDSLDRYSYTSW